MLVLRDALGRTAGSEAGGPELCRPGLGCPGSANQPPGTRGPQALRSCLCLLRNWESGPLGRVAGSAEAPAPSHTGSQAAGRKAGHAGGARQGAQPRPTLRDPGSPTAALRSPTLKSVLTPSPSMQEEDPAAALSTSLPSLGCAVALPPWPPGLLQGASSCPRSPRPWA